jgi:hypothetical protein
MQVAVRMRDAADRKRVPVIVVAGTVVDRKRVPVIVVAGTVVDRKQVPVIVVADRTAEGAGRPQRSRGTPVRSAAPTAVPRQEIPVAVETRALPLSGVAVAVAGRGPQAAESAVVVELPEVAEEEAGLPEAVAVAVVAAVVAVAEGADENRAPKYPSSKR